MYYKYIYKIGPVIKFHIADLFDCLVVLHAGPVATIQENTVDHVIKSHNALQPELTKIGRKIQFLPYIACKALDLKLRMKEHRIYVKVKF